MDNELRQSLIDKYNELLINIHAEDISKLQLGFIQDSCTASLFSILIHCVENIEIFNKTQLNNISNFITKLTYGG